MAVQGTDLSRAAGTVPFRRTPKGPEVLLIHRPRYDDWSLPKGHLDPGETFETAALRENIEETGIGGTLRGYVGAVGYRPKRRDKVVRYWLMSADATAFVPNNEADEAAWLRPNQALKRVSYKRDRNVIKRGVQMLERPQRSLVYVVRHALAGKRTVSTSDKKRPLSTTGKRQAAAISARFLKTPVTSVHSSPFVRCLSTVEPLAMALGEDIQRPEALKEGSTPESVVKWMRSLAGEQAVVCTHGDVVGGLIGHLAAEGVKISDPLEWKKASIWTIDLNNGRPASAAYRPPPPV